jgi:hypothetical protein
MPRLPSSDSTHARLENGLRCGAGTRGDDGPQAVAPSIMEDSVKVRTMASDDENRAIDTVVLGFAGDP